MNPTGNSTRDPWTRTTVDLHDLLCHWEALLHTGANIELAKPWAWEQASTHHHPTSLRHLPATCPSPPPPTSTATQPNIAITKPINHAASAAAPNPVVIARARSTTTV